MSSPNPFQSKEFLELKDYWDRKLKESGFEDVEKYDKRSGETLLIAWDSCYFQIRNTPDEFESQHQYYLLAYQFLHSHQFESEAERHAWRLHSDGIGVREIAKYLIERGTQTNKDAVARVVNRLKGLMREHNEVCKRKISSQLDLWTKEVTQVSSSKLGSKGSDTRTLGLSTSTKTPTSKTISRSLNQYSNDQTSQLQLPVSEKART